MTGATKSLLHFVAAAAIPPLAVWLVYEHRLEAWPLMMAVPLLFVAGVFHAVRATRTRDGRPSAALAGIALNGIGLVAAIAWWVWVISLVEITG